jgi:hypothetical protein
MMRAVRSTTGTLLAATLLTLSIGLQIVEATGRWDRTFQDTGDETVIVTVVLCIGAALVFAATIRPRASLSAIQAPPVLQLATPCESVAAPDDQSHVSPSPPLRLRI